MNLLARILVWSWLGKLRDNKRAREFERDYNAAMAAGFNGDVALYQSAMKRQRKRSREARRIPAPDYAKFMPKE